MAAALQIRKVTDNLAKRRQDIIEANATVTSIWSQVDAAEDETFENRVKGTTVSALDDAFEGGAIFDSATVRSALKLFVDYANLDLGLTVPYLDSYLTSVGMRVAYEFAEIYHQCFGGRMLSHNIFPKGTLVADEADPSSAGMHLLGTLTGASTYASVDGATPSTIIGAVITAISREASQGASSLVMTCTRQDATTVDLDVAASETQYAQVDIGIEAITGVDGAVFSVAETEAFKVGEYVLLVENADGDTSLREVAKIATDGIVTDTSIEFETAPVNTFSAAGYVIPLFTNIAYKSGTTTEGKHLDFYAKPDRIIYKLEP
jgi:hypothetical protein